jgi:hypothetical protein
VKDSLNCIHQFLPAPFFFFVDVRDAVSRIPFLFVSGKKDGKRVVVLLSVTLLFVGQRK